MGTGKVNSLLAVRGSATSVERTSTTAFGFGHNFTSLITSGGELLLAGTSVGFYSNGVGVCSLCLSFTSLESNFALRLSGMGLNGLVRRIPLLTNDATANSLCNGIPLQLSGGKVVCLQSTFICSPPKRANGLSVTGPRTVMTPVTRFNVPNIMDRGLAITLGGLGCAILHLSLADPHSSSNGLELELTKRTPINSIAAPISLGVGVTNPVRGILGVSVGATGVMGGWEGWGVCGGLSLVTTSTTLIAAFNYLSIGARRTMGPVRVGVGVGLGISGTVSSRVSTSRPMSMVGLLHGNSIKVAGRTLLRPHGRLSMRRLGTMGRFGMGHGTHFRGVTRSGGRACSTITGETTGGVISKPLSGNTCCRARDKR